MGDLSGWPEAYPAIVLCVGATTGFATSQKTGIWSFGAIEWFGGGVLNAAHNYLDRHIEYLKKQGCLLAARGGI